MPDAGTQPLDATKTDSPIDTGFDTLACMPEQFLPFSSLAANLQPEKRLMLAVLEDAVTSYFRHAFATSDVGEVEFREATEWIHSPDNAWPFSFLNICTALSIEPDYVRRGLARWRELQKLVPAAERRPVRSPFRRMNGTRTKTRADAPGLRLAS